MSLINNDGTVDVYLNGYIEEDTGVVVPVDDGTTINIYEIGNDRMEARAIEDFWDLIHNMFFDEVYEEDYEALKEFIPNFISQIEEFEYIKNRKDIPASELNYIIDNLIGGQERFYNFWQDEIDEDAEDLAQSAWDY